MPNTAQIIDDWFRTHFSHFTPGTPDHFTAARAKADLLVRLTPPKRQPAQPTS
jgi:hypothetical protein